MVDYADTVFINGSVITFDQQDRICEAVAIVGNRISSIGTSKEIKQLIGPKTKCIDLAGRSLIPGFIDAHCHAGLYGAVRLQIDCTPSNVLSVEDIKKQIRKRAASTPPGGWIIGWGYNDTKLKEKRHPNRWDLDQAAPDHRVFLTRTCGHIAVANSLVLAEFEIGPDTPDPDGGKIDKNNRGEPTGILYEQAKNPIRMKTQPTSMDLEKGMAVMNDDFLELGITSVHDASGLNPEEIRAFQKAVANKLIRVRLYLMVRVSGPSMQLGEVFLKTGLITGFGNDHLRLGPYKLMMDGSGSGGSAAMRHAYPNHPNDFGLLYMSQIELDELVRKAHLAGYQVAVHAIGDQAIEMTITSFERAVSDAPRLDHRHRIEHCGFLEGHLIERIKNLNILPILGLPFLYELGDNYIEVFGRDRLAGAYPLKSLMDRGIIAPLSSDTPVIKPNPIHGIYFAVTRKTISAQMIAPHESVSVMEAIRAYTIFGAYASFEENIKGSVEIGKLADLVVLSANILETPSEEILGITPDLTMVDGEILFEKN
jgi:predicted amidohydrolase YtcJ